MYSPPFDEFEVEHVSIPEKARFQGIQTYLPENQVSLYCCLRPAIDPMLTHAGTLWYITAGVTLVASSTLELHAGV